MTGFKNFLLRGDLVTIATGLIIAVSFNEVVTRFTEVLMGFIGKLGDQPDFSKAEILDVNVGNFINAVISFLILATVVYFFVVLPYQKARERYFPAAATGPSEAELLVEIRDLLAAQYQQTRD